MSHATWIESVRSVLQTRKARRVSRRPRKRFNERIQLTERLEDRTLLTSPPVSMDDSFYVASGSTLNGDPGVLSNDHDPDGDPMTAVLHTGPGAGSLTLNADGTFQYTPDSGFSGDDTFVYYLSLIHI